MLCDSGVVYRFISKSAAELNDASVSHMLRLIYPRLEAQLMLAKNCQLIEALQEVQIHEQDTSFLSPQCQFILGKGRQTTWRFAIAALLTIITRFMQRIR